MPSDRTTVTELGTALGMLGAGGIDEAVRSRTPVMRSLSPETWDQLGTLRAGGAYDAEFHAAWENGRAFLAAGDGLRGRLPTEIEWKGTGRAPGDEVAPIDLRVDHVYLVSCKYLSDILFNVAPHYLFDRLLAGGPGRARRERRVAREHRDGAGGGPGVVPDPGAGADEPAPVSGEGDWYAAVAPAQYQALYAEVRRAIREWDPAGPGSAHGSRAGATRARAGTARRPAGAVSLPGLDAGDGGDPASMGRTAPGGAPAPGAPPPALRALPERAVDLTAAQRDALGHWLRPGWPPGAKAAYADLSAVVSARSVRHWEAAMDVGGGSGEAMLWRLLRMGSAPYFVLGSSATRSLRLRIATPWDWRQHYAFVSLTLTEQPGGQPRVGWQSLVRDRATNEVHEVAGHIEVRWSHGRFGGPPEAKGYLDTPHHLVPGYFPLR